MVCPVPSGKIDISDDQRFSARIATSRYLSGKFELMSSLRSISFIILCAVIQLVGCGFTLAETPSDNDVEVLYTSLSGAYRIERNGDEAWLVSVKDRTQRTAIPSLEGISPIDDEYHSSPNDEWIFGVRRIAHGFSNGDLFHRVDPQHIEIAPTKEDQSFNDRVWPFCVRQGALKANCSLEEADADVGETSFAAWSLDSARLLVQLRGGNRKKMLHTCYVYFNTRSENFEMTDYLRKLNKAKSEALACAEPTDRLPSEAELKTRFDKLDQQLNKTYGEVIAKITKDRVSLVREAQGLWIKHRDEGEKLYVSMFPQKEREQRRLQFLGDVTAARIEVPTEQWEL
jgi:uncharacterized protein YecT (DUF1311 family)